MINPRKPARVPSELFNACGYFLPRVMFLNATHAAHSHWGDVAIALNDFPTDHIDLASEQFWVEWKTRWVALGDRYVGKAEESESEATLRRMYRSAAACYHWSEFMYFSDRHEKTRLRERVKKCFRKSLDHSEITVREGEFTAEGGRVPYYLVLPKGWEERQTAMPCVILSNGLDSATEVEIFAIAEKFLERGIAAFLFDGPGQGIQLGQSPLSLRYEAVVQRVIDTLRGHAEVDVNKLAFFGVSFGGYIALRVAKYLGDQFRCVVNLSGGPRLAPYATLPRRLKEDFAYAFMQDDSTMQRLFDQLALDTAEPVKTNVLSLHGARDDIFPLADVEAMGRNYGTKHELRVYESEAHVCLNYINQYVGDLADWVRRHVGANASQRAK